MPSLEVCIAAWKSWTSCGPLIPVGAALLSLTPSTPAAAFAPNAISWNAFCVVVAVIIARVTSFAACFPPPDVLAPPEEPPPHAATPSAKAASTGAASATARGERPGRDGISTPPET